ncbi:hypothetical protein TRFO_00987 [Tritrichomonas foetus]|uniref:Vps16 N-terminal domain-containing protein n=1 Tax=Tritrichomonas foetus TaxID=1144522 RepID=A0A1J4L2L3_9EUKA|nr:hypothetical protein TRFO_00987 [Tritrichomonas foetus]|eukprot:OHT17683.1 hypothetical protein TRFO_00987 [Tritrichomonas foetus]
MEYDILENLKATLKSYEHQLYSFHDSTYILQPIINQELLPRHFFYIISNFETDTICAAAHGGGFACQHQASGETPRPIEVYDDNLKHILSIFTPKEYGSLSAYYYSPEELLICLFTNRVCIYNQRGQIIENVILFEPEENEFFEFASFHEFGFFVVTTLGNVYYVSSYLTFECEKFAFFNIDTYDSVSGRGSAALPADTRIYLDGEPKGYAPMLWISATKGQSNFLICVQKGDIQTIQFPVRIISLQYSPDYSRVAAISADQIHIFDRNFSTCQESYNIPEIGLKRVSWCGNSSLLIAGNDKVIMIGSASECVVIPIPGDPLWRTNHVFVVPEVDGCRILTRNNVFYLRKIDGTALDLVKRNKSNPALKLIFDSSQKLTAATTDISSTIPELGKAVDGCLSAVQFFRDPSITHLLLRLIVKFKVDVKDFNFQQFSDIVMFKRITEQLSKAPTFMKLTVSQYKALGYDHLLMRLCNRYQHYVAYRVADYLNVSYEPLYNNWAHSLIFSTASNQDILEALKSADHSFDYVQLATAAYMREQCDPEVNLELAKKLIDLNGVKARSLPLLIMWKAWDMAIKAAVESNDTSLLMYTLKVVQEEIRVARGNELANPHDKSHTNNTNLNLNLNLNTTKKSTNTIMDSATLQKKVNQVLLENPIALEAWILLNPEDPNITDLLAKSGNKKAAINREFLTILQHSFQPEKATTAIQNVSTLKKKASKLNDSFGQKNAQRFVDMVQICKELNIQNVETPLEALDEVIKKNGNLKEAKKKLNISEDELQLRKLEIGFSMMQNGQGTTLFVKTLKEYKEKHLIDITNEFFRQRRFDITAAIEQNCTNEIVKLSINEFKEKYKVVEY